MIKKRLYTYIVPYLIFLILIIYPVDFFIFKLPPFIENPSIDTALFSVIPLTLILFLLLFLTYRIYVAVNTPLYEIINLLDHMGDEDTFEKIKFDSPIVEYNSILEKINKLNESREFNVKKGISASVELERSNLELNQAYQKLKELDVLKANFLANTSHELRTPLIFIEGNVEYLNTGKLGVLNEKQKKSLAQSIEGIKRLKKMINQLLLYSRLDAKLEVLEPESVDIEALSKEIVNEYLPNAKEKELKLMLYSTGNLPKVYVDKEKIKTVVSNLVDNAVKFTEKGEVRVMLENQAEGVRLSIYDTGIGIPKYYQARLSDNFSQLDTSTSRKYGGVGLGLTIVKSLLELHELKLNFQTKENKGSIFYFTMKPFTGQEE